MFVKNVAFVFIFFLYNCLLSSYTIEINDLKNRMDTYRSYFVKEDRRSVMKTNMEINNVVTNIYNKGNHYLRLNFSHGIVYPNYYIVISGITCIEFFDGIHNRIFSASCSKIKYSYEFQLIEFSGDVIIVIDKSGERINLDNVIFNMSDGKFYSYTDTIVTKGDNDIMYCKGLVATSKLDVIMYNIKYHGKNKNNINF